MAGLNPKIRNLSNQIRSAKEPGEKFVVMLGAGASLKSGIKPTTQIMTDLLAQFGDDIPGVDLRDRFNKLWVQWSDKQRNQYLEPCLTATPSPGYERLATILRKGYIDTIVTFNFDNLLQKALDSAGLREGDHFKVIIRGDHADEKVITLMEEPKPRIKILKLHGSLTGATFLWSDREMLNYPTPIARLVEQLTSRPIVICGYGFQDTCVVRAFSTEGEAIYCVSPRGIPPGNLRGFMDNRRSSSLVIDGSEGEFDNFFSQLAEALEDRQVEVFEPRKNPFKYLESYDIEDSKSFLGRDNEAQQLTRMLEEHTNSVICIAGALKSGKTSLVRAGVLAKLDEYRYLPVYLRCRGSLNESIDNGLGKWLPDGANGKSGVALLQELAAKTNQHVVVVLDQFERVLPQQPKPGGRAKDWEKYLRELIDVRCPNLTILCVGIADMELMFAVYNIGSTVLPFVMVSDLDPLQVNGIIRELAARAGIEIAPEIIAKIQDEYERELQSERRFTLSHVQAVCHLLCQRGQANRDRYEELMRDARAPLELAINRYDIVNFIEDVPNLEERCLLRDMIRLVSHAECNQKIVNYVREHVSERWAQGTPVPPARAR